MSIKDIGWQFSIFVEFLSVFKNQGYIGLKNEFGCVPSLSISCKNLENIVITEVSEILIKFSGEFLNWWNFMTASILLSVIGLFRVCNPIGSVLPSHVCLENLSIYSRFFSLLDCKFSKELPVFFSVYDCTFFISNKIGKDIPFLFVSLAKGSILFVLSNNQLLFILCFLFLVPISMISTLLFSISFLLQSLILECPCFLDLEIYHQVIYLIMLYFSNVDTQSYKLPSQNDFHCVSQVW